MDLVWIQPLIGPYQVGLLQGRVQLPIQMGCAIALDEIQLLIDVWVGAVPVECTI